MIFSPQYWFVWYCLWPPKNCCWSKLLENLKFLKNVTNSIQSSHNPDRKNVTPMCHSVTNFYFSPQAPIPTSFADHFCSSQSKKETAEKMFFFCNKNWNKIKFNCVRISRLQRRRKIAILHLISRWSSNESSELSFLLFISRFYYAKQRVKFMGCEMIPDNLRCKTVFVQFRIFRFPSLEGSSFRGMLSQHLIANVLWGVLFAISSLNLLLCIYSPTALDWIKNSEI